MPGDDPGRGPGLGSGPTQAGAAPLGVLSVHFERGRCRVKCPFCYLGAREGAVDAGPVAGSGLLTTEATDLGLEEASLALLEAALHQLPYRELAITVSEPIEPLVESGALSRLLQVAQARRLPRAVTTTLSVAVSADASLFAAATRLNLSIDPFKGPAQGRLQAPVGAVLAADVDAALRQVADRWPQAERVLIATLSTQRFAEQLCDGLLAELVALPSVDRIALNAVKPPPAWCDRAFWLRALHRLRPLLAQHLDSRLFLDCYVAARILGLGDCPARPDVAPAPAALAADGNDVDTTRPRLAFRGCVYQPGADFTFDSSDDLIQRLHAFRPPAVCPFPIR
ncbi:MAG: hypothetical protein JNJ46_29595 [Myxococcales bacterium]|nr:hypothetical protein [Myxococcales bacterium]